MISPAYEGGHPDHDSAALAVAAHRGRSRFEHLEFPLYHAAPDRTMVAGVFSRQGYTGTQELLLLSPEERRLKAELLNCFPTQKRILSAFPLGQERFRKALDYDFSRPPHPGKLLYEHWGWNISGAQWRKHAQAALNIASD